MTLDAGDFMHDSAYYMPSCHFATRLRHAAPSEAHQCTPAGDFRSSFQLCCRQQEDAQPIDAYLRWSLDGDRQHAKVSRAIKLARRRA